MENICIRCHKPIFASEGTKQQYHLGCARLASLDRKRAKARLEAIEKNKEYYESGFKFLNDEDWYKSDYYKRYFKKKSNLGGV